MVILLLPLVAAILLCYYTRWPINLLAESECDTLDSLYSYVFVLKSEPRSTTECERFEAQVLAHWDTINDAWSATKGKVLLYVRRDSVMPQQGDTIMAKTRLHRGDSIGDFDYGTYLRRQGFIGTAYAGKWSAIGCQSSVFNHQSNLQERLYKRLEAGGLRGDELATVGALTLGYKEDIDPQLKHHFQASGAAHVLAVSGLHTGILYGIILWLFTLGGLVKPKHENILGRCSLSMLIISAMWFYAWITGMTPSVVRAVLMVTIFEIGRMAYRQAFSTNTIAAAAVLILLVHPLDLWSVSFQLSFAATFSIVLCARHMERYLHRKEWKYTFKGKVYAWITGTIIVSLAAQLGTLPITIYYFGQISPYFLLTNLIVLPLAFLLVPFGLVSILLGGSEIGHFFTQATSGLSWLMNHSVRWIESLPGSTIPAHIDGWMIGVYYALFLLFYVLVLKKRT